MSFVQKNCHGCPFQSSCAKGKDTKSISVSMKNQKQRQVVRERLTSEEGEKKYRQRKIEAEPVFGQIKYNSHFQRFTLRGLSKTKTTVEWGLICVAHKLKKWATSTQKEQKTAK
ncbi:transposase [Bacillota bacterium Lsc_1132]